MASKLSKAFAELRKDGWYCAFCLPCCQNCAWGSIPFNHEVGPCKGEKINSDKVLFNHSQDWHAYRKKGETMLTHSGKKKLVRQAIKVLEKHGCTVEWNGRADIRLWVSNNG